MRSGRDYIQALRDDRAVYLGGKRVGDVTEHAAFAAAVQAVAGLYDLALDPAAEMSYSPHDSTNSDSANQVFLIPRSREDLQARRLASTRWAQATHGFFGHGPDHVAGFLAGFA